MGVLSASRFSRRGGQMLPMASARAAEFQPQSSNSVIPDLGPILAGHPSDMVLNPGSFDV